MVRFTSLLLLISSLSFEFCSAFTSYDDMPSCGALKSGDFESMTQLEIEAITPCIIYDTTSSGGGGIETVEITLGQTTDTRDGAATRDGAKLAVDKINALNGGKGFAVGYLKDRFVRFRLVSVIAGIDTSDGFAEEFRNITGWLTESEVYKVDMFVGTKSWYAEYERDIINAAKKIVTAQVGPGVYYEDSEGNPNPELTHVFGIHLSSYTYTYPALLAAKYQGAETFAIAGRDASVFFQSTCAKAEEFGLEIGMIEVIPRIEYAAQLKDDEEYQRGVARDLCNSKADVIIGCIGGGNKGAGYEADWWIDEWKKMGGCKPDAVWLTCTTWGWQALEAKEGGTFDPPVPLDFHAQEYMLGGGQWHPAMTYGDEFFSNGAAIYAELEATFGYATNYDAVASYVIPYMYYKTIEKTFRGIDLPDVSVLNSAEYLELVRRQYEIIIELDTIYGPIQFDEYKRNVGRFPSGSQLFPVLEAEAGTSDGVPQYTEECVFPTEVSTEVMVFPIPYKEVEEEGPWYSDTGVITGLCILLVAAIVGVTLGVQKRSRDDAVFDFEKQITPTERTIEVCNRKINAQKGWLTFDLFDVASDVQKGITALFIASSRPFPLFVSFVLLALFSLYAGYNAIIKRTQVINKFSKIRDGDEEIMAKYSTDENARADSQKKEEVDDESISFQWDIVCLEIFVATLSLRNGLIEDLPSLILNVVDLVYLVNMSEFKAGWEYYATLVPILMSCICGGRKTYLYEKIGELRIKKGDLERLLKGDVKVVKRRLSVSVRVSDSAQVAPEG